MENLKEELQKLLTIIKDAPSVRVGLFCDKESVLIDILNRFCANKDNIEFVLNITNKELFENFTKIKAKFFNLKRPNYFLNGKFYDYFFVDLNLDDSFKEEFLKKSHKTIKNAGLILILEENDFNKTDNWFTLLEENYYVATSKIDLDKNRCLIISRKMHGWGG